MNFIYTFYKSSGEIVENVNVSEEVFSNIISETQYQYIEGSYNNENYYIDNGTPVLKPLRPDIFHEFNYELKQWQPATNYLSTIKTSNKEVINTLSGDMILRKYPTYRQINYNREPTAPATIEMNLWIDAIRAESNIATSSIDSAADLATIEGIVDGFKAYLAGL